MSDIGTGITVLFGALTTMPWGLLTVAAIIGLSAWVGVTSRRRLHQRSTD
jgi:hypothetical protein